MSPSLEYLERCAAESGFAVATLEKVARFVAIAGTLDHPLGTYGQERLEAQLTQQEVEERLLPVLAQSRGVEAGEPVAAAWQRLGGLLDLRPEETLYMNELAEGRLALEGLFNGDQEEIDRFAQHPALRWKAINVRKHHQGDA